MIPAHYQGDPMAMELIRCGLPIEQVDALVEQAAIYEHLGGLTRQEAEESGADLFLTKPFSPSQLLVEACRLLGIDPP